jgi:hypothetical protein
MAEHIILIQPSDGSRTPPEVPTVRGAVLLCSFLVNVRCPKMLIA